MAGEDLVAPRALKVRQVSDVRYSELGFCYVETGRAGHSRGLVPAYTSSGRPSLNQVPDGILIYNAERGCLELSQNGQWVSFCGASGIGVPSDGSFDDGAVSGIDSGISMADAIDLINEYLTTLVCPSLDQASHLGATDGSTDGVLQAPVFATGRVASPTTSGNPYYTYGWDNDTNRDITNTSSLVWASKPAQKITDLQTGTITLRYYDGSGSNVHTEVLVLDGTTNTQISIPNGHVTVSGLTTLVTVIEGYISINIPASILLGGTSGYLKCHVDHVVGVNTYNNPDIEFFRDAGNTPAVASQSGSMTVIPSLKYLSGVGIATVSGSTLPAIRMRMASNNMWADTYRADPLQVDASQFNIPLYTVSYNAATVTKNGTTPPAYPFKYTEDFSYDEVKAVVGSVINPDSSGTFKQIRYSLRDPFNVYTGSYFVPTPNPLINTYGNVATDTDERFLDENYRLDLSASGVNLLTAISGSGRGIYAYNSTTSLVTVPALQVLNGALIYPQIDFGAFTPVGNPNYTSLSGVQVGPYMRRFRDSTGAARSNGVLLIQGMSESDRGSGNILVDIRVVGTHIPGNPTQGPGNEGTGWLSLNAPYNFATFLGDDGDGCFVTTLGYSAPYFEFTLGGFSTAYAGNQAIEVRITYVHPAGLTKRITRLQVTNWL